MADLRGCRVARMSVVAFKRTGLVASVKAAMDRTGMAQAVIPPVVLTPEAIVVAAFQNIAAETHIQLTQ